MRPTKRIDDNGRCVIPEGMTSMPNFNGNRNLKTLEIPASLTKIDPKALSGCENLSTVTISQDNPDYKSVNDCCLSKDGKKLIFGCRNSVIPDGVTEIGEAAFKDCTGLTSVKIPASVKVIGESAFSACTGLTSVVIPDGVTEIGEAAFKDCTGLTTIEIPNSVTSIGDYTFSNCSGLNTIVIPDSVKVIGENAFSYCKKLTSIEIPYGVTLIKRQTFTGSCRLTTVKIPNSVTVIKDSAFWNCTGLISIDIPDSVTKIENRAFSGCTGLTCIKIPNSVTEIGECAFWGCSSLDSITISEGNSKYISAGNCCLSKDGKELVFGCKSSIIPDSVTKIRERAFEDCTGLTEFKIPDSVTEIGTGAFCGCCGLTTVEIADSVRKIGDAAFLLCTRLTSIKLPDKMTEINDRTFERCSALTDIKIPNTVTKIGRYAFRNCTGLSAIRIPSSVTDIEGNPFSGCSSVDSIIVDKGNANFKSVDNCCVSRWTNELKFGCKNSIIPDSITIIGENAFEDCTGLTAIRIPDRVKEIRESAFDGCSALTTIEMPDSVGVIEKRAFNRCPGYTGVESSETAEHYEEVAIHYILDVKNYPDDTHHIAHYRDKYGFPQPEDFPFDPFLNLKEFDMADIIATLYGAFNKVNRLFGHFSKSAFSWSIKNLYISADRKYLVEYFRSREWQLNPWTEDELRSIPVLGEYYHKDFITLYYNTIKDTARNAPEGRLESSVLTVMRYVYLHEMMHQYFDRFDNRRDEMEIEEGLAEFGALYVLDELVKKGEAYKEELEWALNFVESKRGILRCYSNGARLFRRYKAGQLELKNILESYC